MHYFQILGKLAKIFTQFFPQKNRIALFRTYWGYHFFSLLAGNLFPILDWIQWKRSSLMLCKLDSKLHTTLNSVSKSLNMFDPKQRNSSASFSDFKTKMKFAIYSLKKLLN